MPESPTRAGRIALAGRPNVGKSSLMNALVGHPLAIVSPRAQATRLPVIGLRTDGPVQMIFQDLPGLLDPEYPMQDRMLALARQGVRDADLVLHLHPAPEAPAPDFSALTGIAPGQLLTVYTKCDLVSPEERRALASDGFPVSTQPEQGLDPLLEAIAARLPEAEFPYPPDDLGTQPLRFFVVEYLREAAFQLLGDELPYAFTAEVDEFRETSDPVYIRATLFVERESQKGMVIGQGGRMIREIGRLARERLEDLTGSKVFLETWVKVLPRWRRDPAQLARFGFPDLREEPT